MRTQNTTRPKPLPLVQQHALLLEAWPTLQRIARHYAAVYGWTRRMEIDDLAQLAALSCLEAMRRGIRPQGSTIAYLVGVARKTVQRYCGEHREYLRTPWQSRTHCYPDAPPVLSLDALLSDSRETLLDLLAEELADEYNASYDAYLDCLPC